MARKSYTSESPDNRHLRRGLVRGVPAIKPFKIHLTNDHHDH